MTRTRNPGKGHLISSARMRHKYHPNTVQTWQAEATTKAAFVRHFPEAFRDWVPLHVPRTARTSVKGVGVGLGTILGTARSRPWACPPDEPDS